MRNYLLTLAIVSIAILSGCKKNTEDIASNQEDLFVTKEASKTISGQFVPNELLVKFKAGTGEKSRTQTLSFIDGKVSEHILTNAMQSAGDHDGIYLVNTDQDVYRAMARMKGESNIQYTEPNWIYTHATTTSNDSYFTSGQLWGMYSTTSPTGTTDPTNTYGSQANTAWAKGHTGSSTVWVGIIDEGAMYTHTDLAANFGLNPGEIANDGIDNDINGYIDDVHGWDFANNDKTTFDGTSDDHGTHVSGTIGGIGGNSLGVAGVNWNVKMISAKFLGTNGGTTANAVKAVDYITNLKTIDKLNIVATNNSWGGGGFSQALQDAITRAGAANILFIAAAGNNTSDNDATANYPSNYPNDNIIAVASLDSDGSLSYYSNWGATLVDLGAPGRGIISTVPASSGKGKNQSIVSAYASYSGTSMATPHVTGAAALYASTHALATAAQIKDAIISAARATPTVSLTGKCVSNGRLNVSGF